MMMLEGKNAIVSGAGRGIGQGIALRLAQDGANVAIVDIDENTATQTAETISKTGQNSVAIIADVGDPSGIEHMVSETLSNFGSIDILVNNAAISKYSKFLDVEYDDWERIQRVNARGVFFSMQRVAKEMVKQQKEGRIINIASVSGKGFKGTASAAYAASKGAVIAMTYIAAAQLAEYDIKVNAICPGITATRMLENYLNQQAKASGRSRKEVETEYFKQIPLQRPVEVEDIGYMASFLAGPGGYNITGQDFNVDGGLLMG